MKFNWKEQTKENILAYSASGILIVSFYMICSHLSSVGAFFGSIWSALMPFVIGFCIAFVLFPLEKIVETKWMKNSKMKQKAKRSLSVTWAMIILLLIIASFFAVLIPQLVSSVETLTASMDGYMSSANNFLDSLLGSNPGMAQYLDGVYETITNALQSWLVNNSGVLSTVVNYSVSIFTGVFNFVLGLIIAVYILLDREKFTRQSKKMMYACMKKQYAEYWFGVGNLTSHMFNRFIFGKALDSLIIGILCWIITSIMQIPYAPLISFIVGLTNMIPVFGPFIGAVPCVFILLIIDPFKALEFAVFILILQQVDGNILGPYILGDSMGLPTLWVMFAIIVGGSLFGIVGMFIGVPVFSVIYVLIRSWANQRLAKKDIEVQ